MSTALMWTLFAVVLIGIVAGSLIYKKKFTVHEIALIGIMAAVTGKDHIHIFIQHNDLCGR